MGPSNKFRKFRQSKGDADKPGMFRVLTTKKKEVHFLCEQADTAELWVRGIKLFSREVIFAMPQIKK